MGLRAHHRFRALVALVALAIACGGPAWAQPPVIYSQPAYQSPVRGAPDDLLMLPGHGFAKGDVVVYASAADTRRIPDPPDRVPEKSNAAQGVADVVSDENVPLALTVRLPEQMQAGQSYVIWVRNAKSEWSNPVLINDARPLWVTPTFVYSRSELASLPRQIKIVGRNLDAAPDNSLLVRLSGPEKVELTARADPDEEPTLREYVAKVPLPARLTPGTYAVEVARDGTSWVPLEQKWFVRADPPARRELSLDSGAFGNCRANDGADDTACIVAAVKSAAQGGGTIVFGPGTWDLIAAGADVAGGDGILLPANVDLRGAGKGVTRLVRHDKWNSGGGANTVFTTLGHNSIRGFTFADRHVARQNEPARPFLQFGRVVRSADGVQAWVEDVVISDNVFGPTHGPIVDSASPMRHIFITRNEFGAFHEALQLGGNRFNVAYPFRFDDSVIAYNTFAPGSSLDVAAGQGALASELGASSRLDFSHNVADGTATEYLNSPEDARGWRAAFFWHMNGNHEMALVSENRALCTGDKAGDGEAIAYDNNAGTFALSEARTVSGSSRATVTVRGPVKARQNDRDVPVASYYVGHWIQIVAGAGLGQVRRITDYRIDGTNVTFTVSPAWDVPPRAGESRLAVGRELWQVYTLANVVDHRQPLCLKSNRTKPKGGVIGLWAQTADSVVAGNRQYDTDGILMQNAYVADDSECKFCTAQTTFQSFVEIRDNLVDGEYQWDSACSISGIMASYAASPTPRSPPPILGFGISISHNAIRHADGFKGGALDFASTWYVGPEPHMWRLIDNTLIQHNDIREISGSLPRPACQYKQLVRAGVRLDAPYALSRTVLYGNSCKDVSRRLEDYGTDTVRVCPSPSTSSCECR